MGLTPMMQQYFQIKEECKDCILFFRLGDFYEMFFEDAEVASRELELVLTGRDCGLKERAPMCGVPYHAANSYISRLINKGYKIAICEQLEDPSSSKGIVKRGVTKIITPGTYTDSSFLEDNKNNYIMSIYIHNNRIGMCFSDISTGDFYCTEASDGTESILNEISKFKPIEIVCENCIDKDILNAINERFSISVTKKDKDYFVEDNKAIIESQFENANIKNYSYVVSSSINGLLKYIHETQKIALTNINNIEFYNVLDFLYLDANTRRNLELTENIIEKTKKNSLLWVLDKTNTAMGGRELRRWIEQPLINKDEIQKRLDAVDELVNDISMRQDINENLKKVYDIERIAGKISSQNVNAKELISLKNSLKKIPSIKLIIEKGNCNSLREMYYNLDELEDVVEMLEKSINEDPSLSIKEGNIIKDGYNEEVDELRAIKIHGKEWIASLENKEKELTGIKSLKIGYNRVFGYYIEVSKSNLDFVPEERYIRKQTLANSERYITPELKKMEDKIIGAEEKLINLEYKLFIDIRKMVDAEIKRLKKSAKILSKLDCLVSFAQVSLENNYSKPILTDNNEIYIKEGRHPVVEKVIQTGTFISNDTIINNRSERLLMITGPNMSGKSTYIRQVALITIMTQIGCFVPAKEANISICDKIFTRIGASDDLAAGKSTFMVEMCEVSNILKNATNNSLVVLDEVGRGTSTFDGLSIAWAVVEYICENQNLKSKTLFATHYHELIELEGKIEGVKNYSIAVKKIDNEIVFLRNIVPGGTDESYGIEVAKLAKLPLEVTSRAEELLYNLEKNKQNDLKSDNSCNNVNSTNQINFLDLEKNTLIKEISDIDIMNKTPIECMNILYSIINKSKNLY